MQSKTRYNSCFNGNVTQKTEYDSSEHTPIKVVIFTVISILYLFWIAYNWIEQNK